jgi:hypothetical protein
MTKWAASTRQTQTVISSGSHQQKTVIYQNWVQGEKYVINEAGWNDVKGTYAMATNCLRETKPSMEVKEGNSSA